MNIATVALCALACLAPSARSDAFDDAWQLVGEGRFAAALDAARAEGDSLAGARARLLVLHHAGDLRGALREGRAGLERHPGDAWLLDQTAYVALSLRAGELGAELARRLAAAAADPALAPDEAARYRERAGAHADEAAAMLAEARARRGALRAARTTVAAVLAAALAFLGWLAFTSSPAR